MLRWRSMLSIGIAFVALSWNALAVVDVYEFSDEESRQRYQNLIEEMRCPKCQNQNLAGSDSPIAKDLRREVHRMIEDGSSDEEIIDFMVARYGEYVLYRPRLSSSTALLWGLPIAMLLIGAIALPLIVRARRRGVLKRTELQQEEQEKLQQLLAQARARDAGRNDAGNNSLGE